MNPQTDPDPVDEGKPFSQWTDDELIAIAERDRACIPILIDYDQAIVRDEDRVLIPAWIEICDGDYESPEPLGRPRTSGA
jgi:hypothetical protein